MSKGGAGKVYFVLYLAVILELLIIIVERDEAEEHLIAKQKESMKIVESILTQLNTGAGNDGVGVRPDETIVQKDQTWKEIKGMELIKEERQFPVEVGVTDVMNDISKIIKDDRLDQVQKESRLRDFYTASNVRDLYYQVWYKDDARGTNDEQRDSFPNDTEIDELMNRGTSAINTLHKGWTLKAWLKRELDTNVLPNISTSTVKAARDWFYNYRDMKYNFSFADTDHFFGNTPADSVFRYDHDRTKSSPVNAGQSLKSRTFLASFDAKSKKPGLYKLYFYSKTNKILGIRAGRQSPDDEDLVNIGTVQLKVKELKNVQKELERTVSPEITALSSQLESGALTPTQFREKVKIVVNQFREDDKPDEAGVAKLFGDIQMILKPGAYKEIEGNRASMGFLVRVVKPEIPISEPKIADLKTVIRVFDKLSKVSLPFQVSPASGTQEITKKPGAVTVTGGTGTASSVGGAGGQWINKNLEIPIVGNLAPRDEPYIFEIVQNASGRKSEAVQCSVYVYASKLTNFDEVKGALEASWGDAIELVAQTPSGSTIKPDEFIMQFNLGGSSQTQPIRKLSVGSNDNVIVPAGSDKVGLSIAWKDPQSGEVVELFNESGEVGLKKPLILTQDLKVDPIMNNNDPEFRIRGIVVRPPQISADEKADIGDVEAQVTSSTVRDLKTNQVYKVMVIGKPKKISGQEYEVTLKLTGGKTPLNKGMVKGNVSVSISATAKSQGATSKPRQKVVPISVSN